MSLEDALAKLAGAKETLRLLVQDKEINSPEFYEALEEAKLALQEVRNEALNA